MHNGDIESVFNFGVCFTWSPNELQLSQNWLVVSKFSMWHKM